MDTLKIDTTVVNAWRSNGDYDYERELARTGQSWWNSVRDAVEEWLRTFFGASFDSIFDYRVWAVIGVVVVLVIVAVIIWKRPAFFFRNKKVKIDYTVSEDTIYGIDFDAEISKAVQRQDWREAIRLTYLKLLRKLSDNNLIDWQIYKTPTKYTFEYRNADFHELTNLFIRVRYGGFTATESDYKKMVRLSESAETAATSTITDSKEGGGE